MSNALKRGWTAGVQAYREENVVPLEEYGYDDFAVRQARYWLFRLYADNTVFTAIEKYVNTHKERRKLYRHIRSIYNPVSRLIDLEVSKVYGGNIDYANQLSGGAIPIVGASPDLLEAIIQLFLWSNMGATKNRFVRNGATYGDSAFKAIDEPDKGKVRLEVLDPRKIAEVTLDAVDNVKAIRIEYLKWDPDKKKDYLYTEVIDQASFRFYRDEKPYAYYRNSNGDFIDGWDNEYGFVPVRLARHKDPGGDVKFGTTSFNTSLSKIDEMNDLASNIHDSIRINIHPKWAVAGNFQLQDANKKVTNPAEKKDEVPFVKIPADSKPYPLVMPLDIPGAIATLDKLIAEIEKDMPQLSVQRMRERGGDMSGVTVKNLYTDASDRFIETQGNYDAATVAAVQMAVTIGGLRGYRNFEAFNLNSYDEGALDFTIKERPVFADELSLKERIELTLQAADSPALRVVMGEMGYSEEQIDEVEDAAQGREAAAMRGLASAAFGDDDEDDTDDEQEVTDAEETNPSPASLTG